MSQSQEVERLREALRNAQVRFGILGGRMSYRDEHDGVAGEDGLARPSHTLSLEEIDGWVKEIDSLLTTPREEPVEGCADCGHLHDGECWPDCGCLVFVERAEPAEATPRERLEAARLAEIKASMETGLRLGVGYTNVGHHVPYLLSIVDSLTAERDEALAELRVARIGYEDTRDQRDIWRARAEATEAEVKRLRADIERGIASARFHGEEQVVAALDYILRGATPPSEGGES